MEATKRRSTVKTGPRLRDWKIKVPHKTLRISGTARFSGNVRMVNSVVTMEIVSGIYLRRVAGEPNPRLRFVAGFVAKAEALASLEASANAGVGRAFGTK
jgi:hypothetical protein